jgi:glycosyltransferase involved in cell wall biosynthesis
MVKRPLTVVQTLPALEGGGVERGTLEVAAELVRCGHRSIVISAGGRLMDELVAAGSEHVAWPIGNKSLTTLRLIPRLRRWLKQESVDIIHARSRLPAWIAYLAWKGMPEVGRPRFVTTCHGAHSVNRYSAVMGKGEIVVAVSEFIRDYLLDNYPGIDEGRIRVIHRGVSEKEFPIGYTPSDAWMRAWRHDYPCLEGKKILTLAGRLTRLKGHSEFIDLIARLNEKNLPVAGLIVGGEDPRRMAYAEEIKAKVQALGLSNVIFTGQRSDIQDIYAVSAIVYSLSAKPESFGRTVVEALSMGRPVLGYDQGGVGEVLRSAHPEGLVSLGDIDNLEEKTEYLLSNPGQAPRLEGFRLQQMLDSTIELYEAAAQSSKTSQLAGKMFPGT